jgi:hypothetical protein
MVHFGAAAEKAALAAVCDAFAVADGGYSAELHIDVVTGSGELTLRVDTDHVCFGVKGAMQPACYSGFEARVPLNGNGNGNAADVGGGDVVFDFKPIISVALPAAASGGGDAVVRFLVDTRVADAAADATITGVAVGAPFAVDGLGWLSMGAATLTLTTSPSKAATPLPGHDASVGATATALRIDATPLALRSVGELAVDGTASLVMSFDSNDVSYVTTVNAIGALNFAAVVGSGTFAVSPDLADAVPHFQLAFDRFGVPVSFSKRFDDAAGNNLAPFTLVLDTRAATVTAQRGLYIHTAVVIDGANAPCLGVAADAGAARFTLALPFADDDVAVDDVRKPLLTITAAGRPQPLPLTSRGVNGGAAVLTDFAFEVTYPRGGGRSIAASAATLSLFRTGESGDGGALTAHVTGTLVESATAATAAASVGVGGIGLGHCALHLEGKQTQAWQARGVEAIDDTNTDISVGKPLLSVASSSLSLVVDMSPGVVDRVVRLSVGDVVAESAFLSEGERKHTLTVDVADWTWRYATTAAASAIAWTAKDAVKGVTAAMLPANAQVNFSALWAPTPTSGDVDVVVTHGDVKFSFERLAGSAIMAPVLAKGGRLTYATAATQKARVDVTVAQNDDAATATATAVAYVHALKESCVGATAAVTGLCFLGARVEHLLLNASDDKTGKGATTVLLARQHIGSGDAASDVFLAIADAKAAAAVVSDGVVSATLAHAWSPPAAAFITFATAKTAVDVLFEGGRVSAMSLIGEPTVVLRGSGVDGDVMVPLPAAMPKQATVNVDCATGAYKMEFDAVITRGSATGVKDKDGDDEKTLVSMRQLLPLLGARAADLDVLLPLSVRLGVYSDGKLSPYGEAGAFWSSPLLRHGGAYDDSVRALYKLVQLGEDGAQRMPFSLRLKLPVSLSSKNPWPTAALALSTDDMNYGIFPFVVARAWTLVEQDINDIGVASAPHEVAELTLHMDSGDRDNKIDATFVAVDDEPAESGLYSLRGKFAKTFTPSAFPWLKMSSMLMTMTVDPWTIQDLHRFSVAADVVTTPALPVVKDSVSVSVNAHRITQFTVDFAVAVNVAADAAVAGGADATAASQQLVDVLKTVAPVDAAQAAFLSQLTPTGDISVSAATSADSMTGVAAGVTVKAPLRFGAGVLKLLMRSYDIVVGADGVARSHAADLASTGELRLHCPPHVKFLFDCTVDIVADLAKPVKITPGLVVRRSVFDVKFLQTESIPTPAGDGGGDDNKGGLVDVAPTVSDVRAELRIPLVASDDIVFHLARSPAAVRMALTDASRGGGTGEGGSAKFYGTPAGAWAPYRKVSANGGKRTFALTADLHLSVLPHAGVFAGFAGSHRIDEITIKGVAKLAFHRRRHELEDQASSGPPTPSELKLQPALAGTHDRVEFAFEVGFDDLFVYSLRDTVSHLLGDALPLGNERSSELEDVYIPLDAFAAVSFTSHRLSGRSETRLACDVSSPFNAQEMIDGAYSQLFGDIATPYFNGYPVATVVVPATAKSAADASVAYTFDFERSALNCLGEQGRLCLSQGTSSVAQSDANADSGAASNDAFSDEEYVPKLDSAVFSLGVGPSDLSDVTVDFDVKYAPPPAPPTQVNTFVGHLAREWTVYKGLMVDTATATFETTAHPFAGPTTADSQRPKVTAVSLTGKGELLLSDGPQPVDVNASFGADLNSFELTAVVPDAHTVPLGKLLDSITDNGNFKSLGFLGAFKHVQTQLQDASIVEHGAINTASCTACQQSRDVKLEVSADFTAVSSPFFRNYFPLIDLIADEAKDGFDFAASYSVSKTDARTRSKAVRASGKLVSVKLSDRIHLRNVVWTIDDDGDESDGAPVVNIVSGELSIEEAQRVRPITAAVTGSYKLATSQIGSRGVLSLDLDVDNSLIYVSLGRGSLQFLDGTATFVASLEDGGDWNTWPLTIRGNACAHFAAPVGADVNWGKKCLKADGETVVAFNAAADQLTAHFKMDHLSEHGGFAPFFALTPAEEYHGWSRLFKAPMPDRRGFKAPMRKGTVVDTVYSTDSHLSLHEGLSMHFDAHFSSDTGFSFADVDAPFKIELLLPINGNDKSHVKLLARMPLRKPQFLDGSGVRITHDVLRFERNGDDAEPLVIPCLQAELFIGGSATEPLRLLIDRNESGERVSSVRAVLATTHALRPDVGTDWLHLHALEGELSGDFPSVKPSLHDGSPVDLGATEVSMFVADAARSTAVLRMPALHPLSVSGQIFLRTMNYHFAVKGAVFKRVEDLLAALKPRAAPGVAAPHTLSVRPAAARDAALNPHQTTTITVSTVDDYRGVHQGVNAEMDVVVDTAAPATQASAFAAAMEGDLTALKLRVHLPLLTDGVDTQAPPMSTEYEASIRPLSVAAGVNVVGYRVAADDEGRVTNAQFRRVNVVEGDFNAQFNTEGVSVLIEAAVAGSDGHQRMLLATSNVAIVNRVLLDSANDAHLSRFFGAVDADVPPQLAASLVRSWMPEAAPWLTVVAGDGTYVTVMLKRVNAAAAGSAAAGRMAASGASSAFELVHIDANAVAYVPSSKEGTVKASVRVANGQGGDVNAGGVGFAYQVECAFTADSLVSGVGNLLSYGGDVVTALRNADLQMIRGLDDPHVEEYGVMPAAMRVTVSTFDSDTATLSLRTVSDSSDAFNRYWGALLSTVDDEAEPLIAHAGVFNTDSLTMLLTAPLVGNAKNGAAIAAGEWAPRTRLEFTHPIYSGHVLSADTLFAETRLLVTFPVDDNTASVAVGVSATLSSGELATSLALLPSPLLMHVVGTFVTGGRVDDGHVNAVSEIEFRGATHTATPHNVAFRLTVDEACDAAAAMQFDCNEDAGCTAVPPTKTSEEGRAKRDPVTGKLNDDVIWTGNDRGNNPWERQRRQGVDADGDDDDTRVARRLLKAGATGKAPGLGFGKSSSKSNSYGRDFVAPGDDGTRDWFQSLFKPYDGDAPADEGAVDDPFAEVFDLGKIVLKPALPADDDAGAGVTDGGKIDASGATKDDSKTDADAGNADASDAAVDGNGDGDSAAASDSFEEDPFLADPFADGRRRRLLSEEPPVPETPRMRVQTVTGKGVKLAAVGIATQAHIDLTLPGRGNDKGDTLPFSLMGVAKKEGSIVLRGKSNVDWRNPFGFRSTWLRVWGGPYAVLTLAVDDVTGELVAKSLTFDMEVTLSFAMPAKDGVAKRSADVADYLGMYVGPMPTFFGKVLYHDAEFTQYEFGLSEPVPTTTLQSAFATVMGRADAVTLAQPMRDLQNISFNAKGNSRMLDVLITNVETKSHHILTMPIPGGVFLRELIELNDPTRHSLFRPLTHIPDSAWSSLPDNMSVGATIYIDVFRSADTVANNNAHWETRTDSIGGSGLAEDSAKTGYAIFVDLAAVTVRFYMGGKPAEPEQPEGLNTPFGTPLKQTKTKYTVKTEKAAVDAAAQAEADMTAAKKATDDAKNTDDGGSDDPFGVDDPFAADDSAAARLQRRLLQFRGMLEDAGEKKKKEIVLRNMLLMVDLGALAPPSSFGSMMHWNTQVKFGGRFAADINIPVGSVEDENGYVTKGLPATAYLDYKDTGEPSVQFDDSGMQFNYDAHWRHPFGLGFLRSVDINNGNLKATQTFPFQARAQGTALMGLGGVNALASFRFMSLNTGFYIETKMQFADFATMTNNVVAEMGGGVSIDQEMLATVNTSEGKKTDKTTYTATMSMSTFDGVKDGVRAGVELKVAATMRKGKIVDFFRMINVPTDEVTLEVGINIPVSKFALFSSKNQRPELVINLNVDAQLTKRIKLNSIFTRFGLEKEDGLSAMVGGMFDLGLKRTTKDRSGKSVVSYDPVPFMFLGIVQATVWKGAKVTFIFMGAMKGVWQDAFGVKGLILQGAGADLSFTVGTIPSPIGVMVGVAARAQLTISDTATFMCAGKIPSDLDPTDIVLVATMSKDLASKQQMGAGFSDLIVLSLRDLAAFWNRMVPDIVELPLSRVPTDWGFGETMFWLVPTWQKLQGEWFKPGLRLKTDAILFGARAAFSLVNEKKIYAGIEIPDIEFSCLLDMDVYSKDLESSVKTASAKAPREYHDNYVVASVQRGWDKVYDKTLELFDFAATVFTLKRFEITRWSFFNLFSGSPIGLSIEFESFGKVYDLQFKYSLASIVDIGRHALKSKFVREVKQMLPQCFIDDQCFDTTSPKCTDCTKDTTWGKTKNAIAFWNRKAKCDDRCFGECRRFRCVRGNRKAGVTNGRRSSGGVSRAAGRRGGVRGRRGNVTR